MYICIMHLEYAPTLLDYELCALKHVKDCYTPCTLIRFFRLLSLVVYSPWTRQYDHKKQNMQHPMWDDKIYVTQLRFTNIESMIEALCWTHSVNNYVPKFYSYSTRSNSFIVTVQTKLCTLPRNRLGMTDDTHTAPELKWDGPQQL